MKKRTKIIGLALAALFAFSAFAAASAQAHEWWVNGKTLPVGTDKTMTGTGGVSTLSVPKLALTLQSKKAKVTGAITNVETTKGVVEAHVTAQVHFEEVTVKGAEAVCTVKSPGSANGEVTTNILTGKPTTTTGTKVAHVLFSPKETSGGVATTKFTEIEILGEECSAATIGAVAITGSVEGKVSPEVGVESTEATSEFPSTPLSGSSLLFGNNPATYAGTQTTMLEPEAGVTPKAKLE
jgi:hypothetical protein